VRLCASYVDATNVWFESRTDQSQLTAGDCGVTGVRQLAAAAERAQEHTFGFGARERVGVVDGG
jgi:hypothetical protein